MVLPYVNLLHMSDTQFISRSSGYTQLTRREHFLQLTHHEKMAAAPFPNIGETSHRWKFGPGSSAPLPSNTVLDSLWGLGLEWTMSRSLVARVGSPIIELQLSSLSGYLQSHTELANICCLLFRMRLSPSEAQGSTDVWVSSSAMVFDSPTLLHIPYLAKAWSSLILSTGWCGNRDFS